MTQDNHLHKITLAIDWLWRDWLALFRKEGASAKMEASLWFLINMVITLLYFAYAVIPKCVREYTHLPEGRLDVGEEEKDST